MVISNKNKLLMLFLLASFVLFIFYTRMTAASSDLQVCRFYEKTCRDLLERKIKAAYERKDPGWNYSCIRYKGPAVFPVHRWLYCSRASRKNDSCVGLPSGGNRPLLCLGPRTRPDPTIKPLSRGEDANKIASAGVPSFTNIVSPLGEEMSNSSLKGGLPSDALPPKFNAYPLLGDLGNEWPQFFYSIYPEGKNPLNDDAGAERLASGGIIACPLSGLRTYEEQQRYVSELGPFLDGVENWLTEINNSLPGEPVEEVIAS